MVEDPDGQGYVLKMGSKLERMVAELPEFQARGFESSKSSGAPTGQKQFVPIDITLPDDDSMLDPDLAQEGGPQ